MGRRGDADVFKPHPAVPTMRDAVLKRFPPLESLSDQDIDTLGVWSVTPEPSDSILLLLNADVTELINGRYDAATGRQLLSAVAETTQLAGWASYDAGMNGPAVPDPGPAS
jgi:hypothetical protein